MNEAEIIKLYCEDKLTPKDIGQRVHCATTTVIKCLKRNSISIRGRSEAQRLSVELGRKEYPKGEHCHQWKGGKYTSKEGYVWVRLQPCDVSFTPMLNRKGYVKEHRLVVARRLGRCLESWEVVHHIDGVKNHNNDENLELLPTQKCHLSDLALKSRLKQLELEVKMQDKEIRLLKWQIKEMLKEVRSGSVRCFA